MNRQRLHEKLQPYDTQHFKVYNYAIVEGEAVDEQ